ncbi:MAG: TIGR03943 family protein [Cyanobacteriota bacterium]|nr:TIGR03943 family protein [Cyanobacteriota bacterium]
MKSAKFQSWIPWIDAAAIAAWGFLMLKYWVTDKLNILIHPAYTWLCVAGGLGLLIVSGFRLMELWQQHRQKWPVRQDAQSMEHTTLFPPGWGSMLLLTAAILGLLITPRPFASQTALEVGVTDLLSATRSQPQTFRAAQNPEDRTLIDWIRTLNVYPEPEAYKGQKVNLSGFVIHPPDFPEDYLVISRFVITCCAADAYPVGLPVRLPENSQEYPADTWLQIEGQMGVARLLDVRKLAIVAESLTEIPEPENPYDS